MKKLVLLSLLAPLLCGCRITTTIVGQGTVTSESGNFNCTNNVGACSLDYTTAGAEVFTAVPAAGWTLAKWTNCNYVSILSCSTSFGQNTANYVWTITATFKPINPPVQAASYTYNALGQRMTKKLGGVTTIFQYDLEGNLIAELNSSGQALRQHVHINDQPIAQLTRKSDGTIDAQYVHADHLGTPTLLTSQSGKVVADIEAMPFGETFVDYAEVEYSRRFPGQYRDVETGFHYNYFRDYDPSTGRYIQSDPIGLDGGMGTYSYALNNPLKYTDLLGLDVLVGQHRAFANISSNPFYHAAIVLRPDKPEDFVNHPLFTATGGREATLGGQAFGAGSGLFGRLLGVPNYPGDAPSNLSDLIEVCASDGRSDTGLINDLIDVANSYDDNALYDPFPDPFGLTFNSNSYVSGVLNAAGVMPPTMPGYRPGYSRPLNFSN